MMREKTTISNWCRMFLGTLFASLLSVSMMIYAAEYRENEGNAPMKILIMLDTSGSMANEKDAIYQAIDLAFQWMAEDSLGCEIELITFTETAKETDLATWNQKAARGDTCILAGLEAANTWLGDNTEETEKCIIFFSDLIDDHSGIRSYDEAIEEQDKMKEIIKQWEVQEEAGSLNYLFITWNKENVLTLADMANAPKEVDLFRCDFVPLQNIQVLQSVLAKTDTTGSEKINQDISQISMAGEMMQKIMELILGSNLECGENTIDSAYPIFLNDSYATYILLDTNGELTQNQTQKTMPLLETEAIKLYRITGEDINLCMVYADDKPTTVYWITIPNINCYAYPGQTRVKTREEFDMFLRIEMSDRDYRQSILNDTITLQLFSAADSEVPIAVIPMEKDPESNRYMCSILLKKAGYYSYSVILGNSDTLTMGSFFVNEGPWKKSAVRQYVRERINGMIFR